MNSLSFVLGTAHAQDDVLPGTAQLSSQLWRRLGERKVAVNTIDGTEQICIAVTSSKKSKGKRKHVPDQHSNATLLWAREGGSDLTNEKLWISAQDAKVIEESRSSTQSPFEVHLKAAVPPRLTTIILTANDEHAYAYAKTRSDEVLHHICKYGIIRRSSKISLQLPQPTSNGISEASTKPNDVHLGVAMTEPVMQGVAEKGYTRLFILPPPETGLASSSGSISPVAELEDIDIDVDFMVPSVVDDMWDISVVTERSQSDDTSKLATANGRLSRSTPVEVCAASTDGDDFVDTTEPHGWMSPAHLGKSHLQHGDWAIIQGEGSNHTPPRLVRVFGQSPHTNVKSSDPVPVLFVASRLLHSLHQSYPKVTSSDLRASLRIRPVQLQNPQLKIPIASAVTIARIASPRSIHKAYQHLFLRQLRLHFEGQHRWLCNKDIIAIEVDEGEVRWGEYKRSTADGEDLELDLPCSLVGTKSKVYFQVTKLEVKCLADLSEDPDSLVEQIKVGRFGAIIDPTITKLVQTGMEHYTLPDASLAANEEMSTTAPSLQTRLVDYVSACLQPSISDYNLSLTLLLCGARGSGKASMIRQLSLQTGVHLLEVSCFDLLGENDVKTEATIRALFERVVEATPCILLLKHLEGLARKSQAMETGQEPGMITVLQECLADALSTWRSVGHPLIVVGTTDDTDKLPTSVLGCFKQELKLEAPSEVERLTILKQATEATSVAPDVSLRALAVQTAALIASDLFDLVRRARLFATKRIVDSCGPNVTDEDLQCAGVILTSVDFNAALEKARESYSESIGAPKIPNVTWDDVGGLASVKSEILDTIQLPLDHPELFAEGLKKRSGILLYGPPGTGKTLLAKAVATSCSLNFFSVKGPELLNMYIGESEANVRRVFQRARDAKPCVIFFDELDSVAPKRGNQGDSGGVMDRIVSQLLAELDGMSDTQGGGADVFVIGATNRPDLLDSALLRPGRFDRLLYLGISETHEAQLNIIKALTRKFKMDAELDLRAVADSCPFNYTGADFYALCSDAMLKAMTRQAELVDDKIAHLNTQAPYSTGDVAKVTPQYYLAEMATSEETTVMVRQVDFENALKELVPSVSPSELSEYKKVQAKFSSSSGRGDEGKGKGRA